MNDSERNGVLATNYPALAASLPRLPIAELPTPVGTPTLSIGTGHRRIAVKYDNLTSSLYGGNKVRKLEYLLPRAITRGCRRIATFGAAGSNHALATALHAKRAGLACTAFLSGQTASPSVRTALATHLRIGTELVEYRGSYASRIATLRRCLWGRRAWVVPMGGSSWLGTIGFVAAGLELASQIRGGDLDEPGRIYVASGTLGTAAGLALGLALASSKAEVHAVRVSHPSIASECGLQRLMSKTAAMMRRLDHTVPSDLARRARIVLRHEFFGPGYAQGTAQTDNAIDVARDQLGLELETTYTGKAFAALLSDLEAAERRRGLPLYWHTYNSAPLDEASAAVDLDALPAAFLRYFSD